MSGNNATPNIRLNQSIESFSRNLIGLREFISVVGPFLDKRHSNYLKDKTVDLIPMRLAMSILSGDPMQKLSPEAEASLRAEFGSEVTIRPSESGHGGEIDVVGEAGKRFSDAIKGLHEAGEHRKLLYRNCLISLTSSAEWFLSQVLRIFLKLILELLVSKTKP